MQAYYFLSRIKLISVLCLLIAATFCSTTQAQSHGGGLSKTPFLKTSFGTTNQVHVGDLITVIISVTNSDEFGDTITVNEVVDVVFHKGGTVTTPNLLSSPVTLFSPFDIASVAMGLPVFFNITNTYTVLPGDETLTNGILNDFASASGTDNHDGTATAITDHQVQPFFISHVGEIKVLSGGCVPGERGFTNCVLGAFSDLCFQPPGKPADRTQALWMKLISTNLVFTPPDEYGKWFENTNDNTAQLTGTTRSITDRSSGFVVALNFSGYTTTPPTGSPTLATNAACLSQVNTANWRYYPVATGTLTGFGVWQGARLSLVRKANAFQVGFGANIKNNRFGASGWFDYTVISQPTTGVKLDTTGQADFNLDIFCCPP